MVPNRPAARPRGAARRGAFLLAALAIVAVEGNGPPAARAQDAGPPLATGTVTGEVLLVLGPGKTAPGSEAVVWLPGTPAVASPGRLEIAQQNKRFVPHVIAVPSGTTVAFPNLDRIYHNVFSVTPGHEFDLGLYHRGTERSQRIAGGGVVQVYCNIHAQMAAYLVVVDGGSFTTTAADGRFLLRGVPAGVLPLRTWQERGGSDEREVVVRPGVTTTVQVVLDAEHYRAMPHKNKHGQDYPPVALDDDRY